MQKIEKWGLFEVTGNGKSDGNPFRDYAMTVTFKSDKEEMAVNALKTRKVPSR